MQAAQTSTKAPRVTLQCVLAEMAGKGDRWAQDELLRVYGPLISSTSMGLLKGCVSQTYEDVKQLTCMALIQLAASFKPERGAVFTTYVFNYLARNIRRDLDGCDSLVKIPAFQKTADRRQLRETGRAKFALAQTMSIDSAPSQDGGEGFGSDDQLAFLSPESIHADNNVERLDAKTAAKALERLSPLDRQVVILRVFQEKAFNEIGPLVGRTHQGALNAYLRGMAKLRKVCGAPQIKNEDVGVCSRKRGRRNKETQQ